MRQPGQYRLFSKCRSGLHYNCSGYQQIVDNKPTQPVPSVIDLTALGSSPPKAGKSPLIQVHTPDSIAMSPAPSPIEDNGLLNVIGTASARPGHERKKQDDDRRSLADTANGPAKAKPKVRALYQVHYDVDVLTKVGVYAGIGYLVV